MGADERVFQYLDLSMYDVHHIKWIPVHRKESIETYATRLSAQILHPRPILIGLSFGGIMAIEIAKQIEVDKIILIASAQTRNEIPFLYRLAGRACVHKLIPARIMKKPGLLTNYLFGASTASDKKLLKDILSDTDPAFLTWAIDKVVNWKNTVRPQNVKHIHGTQDRILPICLTTPHFKIKGGVHLMTITHAEEITNILKQEL